MSSKLGYFNSVISDQGKPLSATITVYEAGTAIKASLFADQGGTIPLSNPFNTDTLGRFQFFAIVGKYDIEVSGTGITVYKIENIALSWITSLTDLLDTENYFGVTPEAYGAVGDGVTDDWAAFNAMFNYLKTAPTKRKKVILSPANYYSIQSRLDATNCFNIEVNNLIMEGPGMGVLTLRYEGALTVVNFLNFPGGTAADYLKLEEMKIEGGVDKATAKATNIIKYNDTLFTSLERLSLRNCPGKCVTGFNWMTEIRHCIVAEADMGLDTIATTAFVANCYANVCRIGYEIFSRYGTYISCASDSADIAYHLMEPWSIALIGCGAEQCDQAIVGTAMALSIQGFQVDQTGKVPIAAACIELNNTAGVIQGLYGKITNTWKLKTTTSPNLILNFHTDFTKDQITTDTTDDSFNSPYWLRRDGTSYYAPGIASSAFKTYCEGTLSYYDGCQHFGPYFNTAVAATFTTMIRLRNIKGWGDIKFKDPTPFANPLIFTQIVDHAMKIENVHIPFEFMDIHFKQSGVGDLFRIWNCAYIKFKNCKFETTNVSGRIFYVENGEDISNSIIEIDKATMDNMTGPWSNLIDSGGAVRYLVKFTGYTAIPTIGYFNAGCRIEFPTPSAGGFIGAVCTADGNPGTWKGYGAIAA